MINPIGYFAKSFQKFVHLSCLFYCGPGQSEIVVAVVSCFRCLFFCVNLLFLPDFNVADVVYQTHSPSMSQQQQPQPATSRRGSLSGCCNIRRNHKCHKFASSLWELFFPEPRLRCAVYPTPAHGTRSAILWALHMSHLISFRNRQRLD